MPGNEETVRIVAMDKSFHVHCYKCEDCGVSLSSNAENAGGCFPLDDHILCKSCNIQRIRKLVTGQEASNEAAAAYAQKMARTQPNAVNYAARSTDLWNYNLNLLFRLLIFDILYINYSLKKTEKI